MSSARTPKRFAVLVGSNVYQSNGVRRSESGAPASLNQLHGCVNDVYAMKRVVQEQFGISSPLVLTAEAKSGTTTPREQASALPTYQNIYEGFKSTLKEAEAGDLFLFHFSGHGARLPVVSSSPKDGRKKDPSLMTFDYCCGKPAVRGWLLNSWLKSFHEKGVQVVVILDSCYSGNAWRGDTVFRTPDNWTPPLNLPADEEAVDHLVVDAPETNNEPTHRNSKLEQLWGIDPKGFTLMTACRSNEFAEENTVSTPAGQVQHGLFTYRLLRQLDQSRIRLPTYRILRDEIEKLIKKPGYTQTPQVYGRDRLTFLGNHEQLSPASNVVQVKESQVIVPLGTMHGIHVGTEFTTCSPSQIYTIRVEWVDATRCGQKVEPAIARHFERHSEVLMSKVSLESTLFKIRLERSLRDLLGASFCQYLAYRVSGQVEFEYAEGRGPTHHRSDPPVHSLSIKAHDGEVSIGGNTSLLGYSGSVRGLKLKGDDDDATARIAAASAAHLIRFSQILNLRHEASQENPGFKVSIVPAEFHPIDNELGNTWNGASYQDKQKLKYSFKNNSGRDMYITILTLGPGFHVRHFWPTSSNARKVRNGGRAEISFNMEIPPELATDTATLHRDIIRTVVTNFEGASFRGMELPDIWDTSEEARSVRRNASEVVDYEEPEWWIDDTEVLTRLENHALAD